MTANHTGGRARCIEQDALETLAVPPAGGVAGITGNQLGIQAQTVEVFPDPGQALGFEVDRDHGLQFRFGFEQVAGLAARRAAGVEHALAGREVEQVGSQLRGFVLNADPALIEPRQTAHIAGLGEEDAIDAVLAGTGLQSRFAQQFQVGITTVMTAVDPQDHRRMRIVGGADGFPLLGPEGLQRFLQPARVGGAHHGIAFEFGEDIVALALRAAQHGVEQGLGPGLFQLVGATHGFTQGGMGRNAGVEQLIQTYQQQRLDIGIGLLERLLQQALGQGRQPWLPACGAECQVLGQATVTQLDLVQLRRQ
ncbi:hypothetical protein D3C77_440660 [compost metagenome]